AAAATAAAGGAASAARRTPWHWGRRMKRPGSNSILSSMRPFVRAGRPRSTGWPITSPRITASRGDPPLQVFLPGSQDGAGGPFYTLHETRLDCSFKRPRCGWRDEVQEVLLGSPGDDSLANRAGLFRKRWTFSRNLVFAQNVEPPPANSRSCEARNCLLKEEPLVRSFGRSWMADEVTCPGLSDAKMFLQTFQLLLSSRATDYILSFLKKNL
ncbi:hypothetical protein E2320_006288, partial [Naja naja]